MSVCGENSFPPRKRSHQSQQAGSRQMEVCQELVHDSKWLARVKKYARFALSRDNPFRAFGILLRAIFERTHNRGSNRQNGTPVASRLLDCFCGRVGNHVAFLVDGVLFQTLAANPLESPQSDVESDLRDFHSPFAQPLQDLRSKVQARCGRCDGRSLARVDRLVALAVERLIGALDVRRQRYMPQAAEQFVKIALRAEAKNSLAKLAPALHLRFKLAFAENNLLTGRHLPARPNERLPRIARDLAHEQHLNRGLQELTSGRVVLPQLLGVDARAPSEEPRWKHSRVVDNQKLVAAQQLRKRAELAILALASASVEQEHPRSVAFGRRPLRDPLGRQLVIEIAEIHWFTAPKALVGANNIGTRLSIVLREHRRRASRYRLAPIETPVRLRASWRSGSRPWLL